MSFQPFKVSLNKLDNVHNSFDLLALEFFISAIYRQRLFCWNNKRFSKVSSNFFVFTGAKMAENERIKKLTWSFAMSALDCESYRHFAFAVFVYFSILSTTPLFVCEGFSRCLKNCTENFSLFFFYFKYV